MTYNGHNNFSNSTALRRREEEEKWWLVFWERQLSCCLYGSLCFPPLSSPFFFLSFLPLSLFALTASPDFEKHYMVWNTTLSTLSCGWQRCPRIVQELNFHPLSTSLLKCSSIHLRRMLRLALKVERILLNEYRQRNATCSIERDFKLFLTFYCFDWVIANTLTHILFPHFRSHIKPKHFYFALTFFEMSHPSYQSRMHYTDTHLSTLLGTESL